MEGQGQLSHELEVGVPASKVWDVYGTLKLGFLVAELLPGVINKLEIVEGDGGVGTVLKLIFPPGNPGPSYHKEKFTKIDNENRLKEVDVIEGGYLDFGFSLYRICFEIIEKDADSSIIKSTVVYKTNADSAANASLVTTKPVEAIAGLIAKYLTEKEN